MQSYHLHSTLIEPQYENVYDIQSRQDRNAIEETKKKVNKHVMSGKDVRKTSAALDCTQDYEVVIGTFAACSRIRGDASSCHALLQRGQHTSLGYVQAEVARRYDQCAYEVLDAQLDGHGRDACALAYP